MLLVRYNMPYIEFDKRSFLDNASVPEAHKSGELNYLITNAMMQFGLDDIFQNYVQRKGLTYQTYNDIMGAWTGALVEYLRRKHPGFFAYEDQKKEQNGEVY